jgi:hypothetical protein
MYICSRLGGASMNDIVNLLVNNGIAVVVVAYFMFRDYKFNNELIKTMTSIQDSLQAINNKIKTGGK